MRSRFSDTVIAEMRGWQDGQGNSPFWEHLGKKFFGIGFQNADYMNAVDGTQFISDLMPRYPIYVDLLPEPARAVIGKPHDDSARALALLDREGFHFADYVDIFDGGPTVQCRTDDIASVRQTAKVTVDDIVDDSAIAGAKLHVISNDDISRYRIIRQPASVDDGRAILGASAAAELGCDVGATIYLFRT
jgi:arginine N-succinyltransferase